LLLAVACDAIAPIGFVLPSLDGTWTISLEDVPGTLRIVVEQGRIVQYDQGAGEFQAIEEAPPMNQLTEGQITFAFQATQAFVGFNNGNPTEFIVTSDGTVQADGSVDLFITFNPVGGGAEGNSNATMRR
jgi:hypothetical protein